MYGSLCKHAELEASACAALELDDNICIVEDVARLAIVALVLVVDILAAHRKEAYRLRAQDEPHEVEVVAALFGQRPARALREAIPVSDLAKEREAVLANGQQP